MTNRKRRSDRNHLIYQLTAPNGQIYIGMTVITGKAINKSLTERWKRHVSRARYQSHTWPLCEAIREMGAESFRREVIAIIRGRAEAHRYETDLIRRRRPELNMVSVINKSCKEC